MTLDTQINWVVTAKTDRLSTHLWKEKKSNLQKDYNSVSGNWTITINRGYQQKKIVHVIKKSIVSDLASIVGTQDQPSGRKAREARKAYFSLWKHQNHSFSHRTHPYNSFFWVDSYVPSYPMCVTGGSV